MKLKLSELNPNPFKKEINGGKLNKEQVKALKSNMKKLGLMGSLPVFKKGNKYFLISGHHRTQALKEVYGKDYSVDVDVKDYSEDNVFRGMVIENLTQRSGEYRELKDNVVAIRKYLQEHKEILKCCRESRKHLSVHPKGKGEKMNKEYQDTPTARDIVAWIDNASGEVIDHEEVSQLLHIHDHLDPELEKTVVKKHAKTKEEREDNSLNYSQAVILSSIKDKEEQKDLAVALKRSLQQRVREQSKLVTAYKEASPEIKKKVRDCYIDITEVEIEAYKEKLKASAEQRKEDDKHKINVFSFEEFETEAGCKVSETSQSITQTCLFFTGLDETNILYEYDWKNMLQILKEAEESAKSYNKFLEKLIGRLK